MHFKIYFSTSRWLLFDLLFFFLKQKNCIIFTFGVHCAAQRSSQGGFFFALCVFFFNNIIYNFCKFSDLNNINNKEKNRSSQKSKKLDTFLIFKHFKTRNKFFFLKETIRRRTKYKNCCRTSMVSKNRNESILIYDELALV